MRVAKYGTPEIYSTQALPAHDMILLFVIFFSFALQAYKPMKARSRNFKTFAHNFKKNLKVTASSG